MLWAGKIIEHTPTHFNDSSIGYTCFPCIIMQRDDEIRIFKQIPGIEMDAKYNNIYIKIKYIDIALIHANYCEKLEIIFMYNNKKITIL